MTVKVGDFFKYHYEGDEVIPWEIVAIRDGKVIGCRNDKDFKDDSELKTMSVSIKYATENKLNGYKSETIKVIIDDVNVGYIQATVFDNKLKNVAIIG